MEDSDKPKKPKVMIIGHVDHGVALGRTANALKEIYEVVIIDHPNEVLEINGVQYELRPRTQSSRTSRRILPFLDMGMALAMATGGMGMGMGPSIKTIEMPPYRLEEEFALIQAKKSRMSRSQRDQVEYHFHRKYKEVKND